MSGFIKGQAIRLVCREFVMLCRKLDLFANAFVAMDGSKFKAVNNRDRNFTKAKMKRRLQQIDESIGGGSSPRALSHATGCFHMVSGSKSGRG